MIFFVTLLMLLLSHVDSAKLKSEQPQTVINYFYTTNNNYNCTGECQMGNVTTINNNQSITNNYQSVTNMNKSDQLQCNNSCNSSVAFSAYLNHNFKAEYGDSIIPFNIVAMNKGNAFNRTTWSFKAPIKGGYTFSISVRAYPSEWTGAYIHVDAANGTKTRHAGAVAYHNAISSNTVYVDLKEGDRVSVLVTKGYRIYPWHDQSATFSGHLIYVG